MQFYNKSVSLVFSSLSKRVPTFKKVFLSGEFIFLVASNLAGILNYLYQYINSLVLTNKGEFGSLGSFVSLSIIISSIFSSPIQAEIVREIKDQKENQIKIFRNWFDISKVFSLLLAAIFVPFLPFSKDFFGIPFDSFVILLLYNSLGFLLIISRGIFQGTESFLHLSLIILIEPVIKVILTIINSFTFKSFVLSTAAPLFGILLSLAFGFVLILQTFNKKENFKLDPKNQKEESSNLKIALRKVVLFLKKSIGTILILSLITGIYSFNLIASSVFLSDESSDTYAKLSLIGKMIIFGSAPVSAIFYPKFFSKDGKKLFKKSIFLTFSVAFTGSIPFLLFPHFISEKLFPGLSKVSSLIPEFTIGNIFVGCLTTVGLYSISQKRYLISFPIFLGLFFEVLSIYIFRNNFLLLVRSFSIINFFTLLASFLTILFTDKNEARNQKKDNRN